MELSQHQTRTELATRSHNNNGEGGILRPNFRYRRSQTPDRFIWCDFLGINVIIRLLTLVHVTFSDAACWIVCAPRVHQLCTAISRYSRHPPVSLHLLTFPSGANRLLLLM